MGKDTNNNIYDAKHLKSCVKSSLCQILRSKSFQLYLQNTHTRNRKRSVNPQHNLLQHTNDLYLRPEGIQKLKIFDVLPKISDK